MSNYSEINNFTALTTAHAVINGAAFDQEFQAIATMSATKYDAATVNIVLTGTLTAANAVLGPPASGITLNVTGIANQYAALISGSAGSLSLGLNIAAGTGSSSEVALIVQNQAQTHTFLQLLGDGSGRIGYNGTGATLTFSAAGNVVINVPTSGVALVATGVAGSNAVAINGANSSTGFGVSIVGNYTGAGVTAILTISDANNTNGVGISLTGNGATTPSKYIRVMAGVLQFLNNAYTSVLFSITDAGNVVINAPTSGVALAVTGAAGISAVTINAAQVSGSSYGLTINGGYTSADYCANFANALGTTSLMRIYGDGGVTLGAASGGDEGAGTLNISGSYYINGVNQIQSGSFTATATDISGSPTVTMYWSRVGNSVTLSSPSFVTGTSTATTFNMSGVPAAITPTRTQSSTALYDNAEDNGAGCSMTIYVLTTNTLQFNKYTTLTGGVAWTASGTKASSTFTTSYTLN